jgi:hypothetical protein
LGRYNDACKDCCNGSCTWQWGIPLIKGERKYTVYYCAPERSSASRRHWCWPAHYSIKRKMNYEQPIR